MSISKWAYIYIIVILLFTHLAGGATIPFFIVMSILSIPFYNHLEKLLEICIIVSTISYYFFIADEQPMSIYTILAILTLIRIIRTGKINKTKIAIPRFLLIVIVYISYQYSELSTFNGFLQLIYIIILSLIISLGVILPNKPFEKLHIQACIFIIYLAIMLVINPISDGQRMQFNTEVNANSFGFASAFLTCIVSLSIILNNNITNKKTKMFICLIGLFLTLLSGSRNSLISVIISVCIIFIMAYRHDNRFKYILYFFIISSFVLLIFPLFGLDSSRFTLSNIIASGGSNRTLIWEEIIHLVREKYFWFGYGPGKSGSTILLTDLVHRTYNSTHNSFVECFAQNGITGLLVLIVIVLKSLKLFYNASKINRQVFLPFGMLLCILIASIGESFYNDAIWWIMVAISTCCIQFNYKKQ